MLTALAVGHIDPEMAYWTTSGGFVFVTILAGTGSVIAPFLGSLLFEIVRSFAIVYTPETWQLMLGVALLLTILFFPGGLWSLFERRARGSLSHGDADPRGPRSRQDLRLDHRGARHHLGVPPPADASASSARTAPARPPSST